MIVWFHAMCYHYLVQVLAIPGCLMILQWLWLLDLYSSKPSMIRSELVLLIKHDFPPDVNVIRSWKKMWAGLSAWIIRIRLKLDFCPLKNKYTGQLNFLLVNMLCWPLDEHLSTVIWWHTKNVPKLWAQNALFCLVAHAVEGYESTKI